MRTGLTTENGCAEQDAEDSVKPGGYAPLQGFESEARRDVIASKTRRISAAKRRGRAEQPGALSGTRSAGADGNTDFD